MREWMTHPKSGISPSPLRLGRFREPIYFLLNSITWKPNAEQAFQFEPVEVPVGFVTDLASIPQIFSLCCGQMTITPMLRLFTITSIGLRRGPGRPLIKFSKCP